MRIIQVLFYRVSVVVNFLSQVIYIFLLFQLHSIHYHTQKPEEQKLSEIKKLSYSLSSISESIIF